MILNREELGHFSKSSQCMACAVCGLGAVHWCHMRLLAVLKLDSPGLNSHHSWTEAAWGHTAIAVIKGVTFQESDHPQWFELNTSFWNALYSHHHRHHMWFPYSELCPVLKFTDVNLDNSIDVYWGIPDLYHCKWKENLAWCDVQSRSRTGGHSFPFTLRLVLS